MMVDNVKLEPLSVQFCGESMLEAQIDLCSTISISIPYPTVNPARLRPVYPVYVSGIPGVPGIIYRSVWPVNGKSDRHICRHGFLTSVRSSKNQSVFFRFCEHSSLTIEGFSILNIASSDSQRDTSKTKLKSEY